MDKIVFNPIGYIRSPFVEGDDLPRQNFLAMDKEGSIEVLDEYKDGLLGLEPGDEIEIIFNFDKAEGYRLQLVPRASKDGEVKGIFATRAPFRPNGIGLSRIRINEIKDGIIKFNGVDMLDGTPVLDIKPKLKSR